LHDITILDSLVSTYRTSMLAQYVFKPHLGEIKSQNHDEFFLVIW